MGSDGIGAISQLLDAIGGDRPPRDVLLIAAHCVADLTGSSRVSVVRIDDEAPDLARVLVSHDAPELDGHIIELSQYPEVGEVLYTGRALNIEATKDWPSLSEHADKVSEAGIDSLYLTPMIVGSRWSGSLIMRVANMESGADGDAKSLCSLVGRLAGIAMDRAALIAHVAASETAVDDGVMGAAAFREVLQEEMDRSNRYGNRLSCVVLSCNVFNGDESTALPTAAIGRISAGLRETDLMGVLEGGRIGLILRETDIEGALVKAAMTRDMLSVVADSGDGGIAVGAAEYDADYAYTPDELIAMAAKQPGAYGTETDISSIPPI